MLVKSLALSSIVATSAMANLDKYAENLFQFADDSTDLIEFYVTPVQDSTTSAKLSFLYDDKASLVLEMAEQGSCVDSTVVEFTKSLQGVIAGEQNDALDGATKITNAFNNVYAEGLADLIENSNYKLCITSEYVEGEANVFFSFVGQEGQQPFGYVYERITQ